MQIDINRVLCASAFQRIAEELGISWREVTDDRVWCGDCQHFGKRNWKGQCGSGNTVFLDLPHRCAGYRKKQNVNSHFYNVGQRPFWE
jgi:hypothetical protein